MTQATATFQITINAAGGGGGGGGGGDDDGGCVAGTTSHQHLAWTARVARPCGCNPSAPQLRAN